MKAKVASLMQKICNLFPYRLEATVTGSYIIEERHKQPHSLNNQYLWTVTTKKKALKTQNYAWQSYKETLQVYWAPSFQYCLESIDATLKWLHGCK